MSIDYNELTEPITRTRFSSLRPAQEKILQVYSSESYAISDIGIELPTGAGKTLIALLILEYRRRRGERVAILTGNKTLARQIEAEAKDLNVPVVRFEGRGDQLSARDLRAYRRAQAIGVMNYWVYINQKPKVEPAEVLVLDDAQLAEGALLSLFSIRIGRNEHPELFDQAMQLFAQHTDSAVADDYVKGLGKEAWGPTDLISFVDALEMHDDLASLIEAELGQDDRDGPDWDDLRFRWNRLRAKTRQALLLISDHEIVVRPYIYPTGAFDHLSSPKQRIFMSATLHDPEDLRRRLGTPEMKKLEIARELVKEESGRRLFVFNQTSSPSHSDPADEVLVPLRELILSQKKSVWLCSSRYEASIWRGRLETWLSDAGDSSPIWELTSLGDEVDQFSGAPAGHLFIAGRFEGMDFPDNTCRLAIFPSLPRATGAVERFISEQLKDAAFQKIRMFERIKQGVGRCNRGDEDYALYYFLDTQFCAEMESRAFSALQSEQTLQQVELGLDLTQDGMGAVLPFAMKFLKGDFSEFDKRLSKIGVPPTAGATSPAAPKTVSDEVNGWLVLFERRDFERAAANFESVSRKLSDAEREHRGFWRYMEAFAEYLRHRFDNEPGALAKCQRYLDAAILEGGSSSWFNRLRKAKNKLGRGADAQPVDEQSSSLDRWDDLVEKYPYFKGRFFKWQASVRAYFDGSHNQICDALETLGNNLGYAATRPSGNGVADGIWMAADHVISLEVKTQEKRDKIALIDVNQADGQRRAVINVHKLPEDHVAALIVTSMSEIEEDAFKALGDVRVLSVDLLREIHDRLDVIMRDYWKGWSRDNAAARSEVRDKATRLLPPSGWLMRAIRSSSGPFITKVELFAEWP